MSPLHLITHLFRKKDLDCAEVRKLSSEYIEGELPPSRLEKFRAHVSGCAPCQSFVDGLASVIRMLPRMSRPEFPPTLNQSIMERLRQEGSGRRES